MPIFVTLVRCEQNFTSKNLQVGEKEKEPKNMTDNATGKNRMSKTSSLQNFLSDARQL